MHAKVSKHDVNHSISENFIDTTAKRYQILKKIRNTKDNRGCTYIACNGVYVNLKILSKFIEQNLKKNENTQQVLV